MWQNEQPLSVQNFWTHSILQKAQKFHQVFWTMFIVDASACSHAASTCLQIKTQSKLMPVALSPQDFLTRAIQISFEDLNTFWFCSSLGCKANGPHTLKMLATLAMKCWAHHTQQFCCDLATPMASKAACSHSNLSIDLWQAERPDDEFDQPHRHNPVSNACARLRSRSVGLVTLNLSWSGALCGPFCGGDGWQNPQLHCCSFHICLPYKSCCVSLRLTEWGCFCGPLNPSWSEDLWVPLNSSWSGGLWGPFCGGDGW